MFGKRYYSPHPNHLWVRTSANWQGCPVYYHPATQDIAFEDSGVLVALPPRVELELRQDIEAAFGDERRAA